MIKDSQHLPVPNSSIIDRIVQINDGASREYKLLPSWSIVRHQTICQRKHICQCLWEGHVHATHTNYPRGQNKFQRCNCPAGLNLGTGKLCRVTLLSSSQQSNSECIIPALSG
jgi:hypothetical protein